MPAAKRRPSPLESLLDDDAQNELKDYLEQRVRGIDGQLHDFREKRKRFEAQMNDNFEWRGSGKTSRLPSWRGSRCNEWGKSIFEEQNDTLNIVGGFAAFMTARAIDDVFGTEPYYAVAPEGKQANILASTIQHHSEWKLRMSPWKFASCEAIEKAIGIGEAVVKQNWDLDVDVYEQTVNLLFDVQANAPVMTSDEDYVYGPNDETGDPGDTITPVIEQDAQTGQARYLLQVEKDPGLAVDVSTVTWKEMEIERTNVQYDNLRASTVHSGDFLAPENVASLEESNFVGQRMQARLSDLIVKYQLDEDTIAELESDDESPKTEAAKPRIEYHETPEGDIRPMRPDPLIEIVECWIKHDPVGDRKMRRMYVLYAIKQRVIVKMDYIANVTPMGKLPYHVVRAFPVPNRWYGRGYFEIYEKAQEFIDRHLNYIALRNRFHANPVIFFNPEHLLEAEDKGVPFEFKPGKTYRLRPGVSVKDVFQFFEIPDFDERTWQLMQMMIQVIQVRSGVTSAAQGEVSSLPSTSTATGIESILASASTLARQPLANMKDGLQASLLYAITLIYANMNRDEVFSYLEGDQQEVGVLSHLDVKGIEMNVRLLLTRFKQRENVESGQKAMETLMQYVQLPEIEKAGARVLCLQIVKGLGFNQAESIIREPMQTTIDPATGQPTLMPQTNGAAPMPTPGGAPAQSPQPSASTQPSPTYRAPAPAPGQAAEQMAPVAT